MIINRYVSPVDSIYNPMSMEELAFAPTFLRQRHDQTAQALSDLDIQSGQYDVLNQYQPIASQLVDPLQKDITNLANELATKGITGSRGIPQAMKLKSQYANLFGQSGAIGQLQSATKQYRTQAEEIQKFFEKNPELARGAMKELQAGQATYQDGKLQIGNMQTPNYVRHYDAKEVNDLLNSQIDNIKDTTLKSLGFSNVGSISSVQDVYRQGQIDGRSKEEITQILMSQLSPEVIQSAMQYGRYALGNEESGLKSLQQQIEGAATGRANQTLRDSYSVISNADKEGRGAGAFGALTTSPGPLVTRTMTDVLKDAGLSFDESGQNIVESVGTGKKVNNWFSGESGMLGDIVGNAIGYNTIKSVLSTAYDVVSNPELALALASGNQALLGVELGKLNLSKDMGEKLTKQTQSRIKEDMTKSVSSFKEAYPELAGISNKDAYEIISQSRNNFSQIYSDVVAPQDADFSYINRQILGDAGGVGDLERRSVYAGDQKLGTGKDLFKQLGYSSFAEFLEKGKPQMETGVTFGAKTPTSFVMNTLDSEGNTVTVNVESNKEFQAAGRVPNKMLEYIQKGDLYKELDKQTSASDFGVTPDEGNSWYYMYDVENSTPTLVEAPKGLNPKALKDYKLNNPESTYTYADAVNDGVQTIFYNTPSGNLLRKKK